MDNREDVDQTQVAQDTEKFTIHNSMSIWSFFFDNLILVHSTHIYLPMKMEQTECSETSAYKLQTPGNYPKESIQPLINLTFIHIAK